MCGVASDDANNPAAASAAWEISIQRIRELNKNNKRYVGQKWRDELLMADWFRRNGQFEKARQSIESGLSLDVVDVINSIWEFELELSEKKDSAVHKVSEAI